MPAVSQDITPRGVDSGCAGLDPLELWNAAQAVRARRNESYMRDDSGKIQRTAIGRGATQRKRLLSGFLRCGECGGAMVAVNTHQYGCAARKDRGTTVCRGIYAPRHGTDTQLLAALRGSLADGKSISQAREIIASCLAASELARC